MPELVVNVLAGTQGVTDIAVGNIIGSNIANILLILGITSIIMPLVINRQTRVGDIPLALMIVVGLALLTYDGVLSRTDAGMLVLFLIIFIYYILTAGKVEHHEPTNMPKRTTDFISNQQLKTENQKTFFMFYAFSFELICCTKIVYKKKGDYTPLD